MGHYVGGFNNGFILLVIIFVLLVIVGNSYPIGGEY
ncbi:YjcZ family sporulation protein [Radiobacillus deserti]|uniref:YjcZ family sporulation protein n=1 Tax=Radiobacillus deserti TaxID=2594883 RepID=A0A516KF00_9BACI|nr:YjcZ family sporulation protein [Radiobacillus deserti]QDP39981.1 YjcZ family sporulation protein [Radiobacillus deserti]